MRRMFVSSARNEVVLTLEERKSVDFSRIDGMPLEKLPPVRMTTGVTNHCETLENLMVLGENQGDTPWRQSFSLNGWLRDDAMTDPEEEEVNFEDSNAAELVRLGKSLAFV